MSEQEQINDLRRRIERLEALAKEPLCPLCGTSMVPAGNGNYICPIDRLIMGIETVAARRKEASDDE